MDEDKKLRLMVAAPIYAALLTQHEDQFDILASNPELVKRLANTLAKGAIKHAQLLIGVNHELP